MQRGEWLTGLHHQVGMCLTRGVVCEGWGLQGFITRWVWSPVEYCLFSSVEADCVVSR